MSGHTPGEWRARRTGGAFVITSGFRPGDMIRVAICELDGEPEMDAQTKADANLIAAAPALLKAAKDAYAHIEHKPECGDDFSAPDCRACALRAAIKRAEGKTWTEVLP